MPFGSPFSIKFQDLLNLLNCNKYNAKTYLLPLSAPPFRINFPSLFDDLSGTNPGRHFFVTYNYFVRIWYPRLNCWGSCIRFVSPRWFRLNLNGHCVGLCWMFCGISEMMIILLTDYESLWGTLFGIDVWKWIVSLQKKKTKSTRSDKIKQKNGKL